MGTESHYPIGTILKRKKPLDDPLDELRVVGGGEKLVVTSNLEFGQPFQLDGQNAIINYDDDLPADFHMPNPMNANSRLTPEEIFSAHARAHPEEAVTGRQPRGGRTKKATPTT